MAHRRDLTETPRPTAAARAYERLTVALHREIRAGRGDDAEADVLRDQMDEPWKHLTTDERLWLGWVSEDLYELSGDRLPTPATELNGREKAALVKDASIAFKEGHFTRALELLRKIDAGALPQDVREYMLGRCWGELGFSYAAAEFFDHAYERSRRAYHAVMALNALVNAGDLSEVSHRIEAIEKNEDAEPALLLRAAALLFSSMENAPVAETPAIYRRVIALAERGAKSEDVVPSLRAAAWVAAGFSYEHLGDKAKAIVAFDQAVRVHENDAALVARGLAQLDTNRPAAMADFQRATNLGTTFPWPYLYLAYEALVGHRFQRLEELCVEGILRARSSQLRAQFYEWLAIAAAERDVRPDIVRERFARALADDPLEARIAENFRAFEAALAGRKRAPDRAAQRTWVPPREPSTAQARRSMSRRAVRMLDAAA